jgi:hypothetical protein
MARIVQPTLLEDGVVVSASYGVGARRLRVSRAPTGWAVEELWTSKRLKPYFNDCVLLDDHLYGFDGRNFVCIDTGTGEKKWRGGRYGHGQVLLIVDMAMLLVQAESGAVVLVEATPEAHREVARFTPLTGKTWSHPVVAGGRLFVRNAAEAACFELTP